MNNWDWFSEREAEAFWKKVVKISSKNSSEQSLESTNGSGAASYGQNHLRRGQVPFSSKRRNGAGKEPV